MKRLMVIAVAALVLAPPKARASEPDPVALAREEGLPTQLLEAKRREAALKHVPESQARAVLEHLLVDLRTATQVVPPTELQARERLVAAAAQALAAGSVRTDVQAVLAQAREAPVQEAALRALVSLEGAGVAPSDAVKLVSSALAGGLQERLGGLRAALETLRRSGYGDGESVALLARSMREGRPPLDVVDERVRRSETGESGRRDGSGTTASASSGGAVPDRDHGTRDDVGAKGSADDHGSNGGSGRSDRGSDGRGGKP